MNNFFVAALIFVSPFTFAEDFPPVSSLCSGPRCTDTMRSIVADYEASNGFWSFEQLPQVASGSCFHIHANLDPAHEHHGMFLFDVDAAGQAGFNGLFSFFAEKNPYEGMTVEEARIKLFGTSPPRLSALQIEDGQALGLIPSSTAKLFYWFRINREKSELYLLSLWSFSEGGASQRAFCRFKF